MSNELEKRLVELEQGCTWLAEELRDLEHDYNIDFRHTLKDRVQALAASDAYTDLDQGCADLARRAEIAEAINADLLEALECAMNGLQWYHDAYGKDEADEEFFVQARAAIAKARGE